MAVQSLAIVLDIRESRSLSGSVVAFAHHVFMRPDDEQEIGGLARQYVDWQYGVGQKVLDKCGRMRVPKPAWID